MTWSYNPTLSANRDKVRFFAADTDSTAAITLTDEEIAGVELGEQVRGRIFNFGHKSYFIMLDSLCDGRTG